MVNTEALEKKIQQSGLRKKYIADNLNISIQTLRLKITNQNEFWCSEVEKLIKLLKLSPKEVDYIFFTSK